MRVSLWVVGRFPGPPHVVKDRRQGELENLDGHLDVASRTAKMKPGRATGRHLGALIRVIRGRSYCATLSRVHPTELVSSRASLLPCIRNLLPGTARAGVHFRLAPARGNSVGRRCGTSIDPTSAEGGGLLLYSNWPKLLLPHLIGSPAVCDTSSQYIYPCVFPAKFSEASCFDTLVTAQSITVEAKYSIVKTSRAYPECQLRLLPSRRPSSPKL